MTTVARHAPGTFCWADLATSDRDGARAFYTRLFGWETFDDEMMPGEPYVLFRNAGRDVGAMYRLQPGVHPEGTPSHWLPYVAVASADRAAARAVELGGRELMPPTDAHDHGRMAVVQDPTGAGFAVWEAKKNPGAQVLGEPGSIAYMQLNASQPEQARAFYTGLFEWQSREDVMDQGGSYTTWLAGAEPRGGMMPMPPGMTAPSHWMVYFGADDVDATTQLAQSLDGRQYVPPTDIPGVGRFAVLSDPQGAAFAVVRFNAVS
jgi:predicted enzyme related to lactoylglutathione lyase